MEKDYFNKILQAIEALQTDVTELKNSIQSARDCKVYYSISEMMQMGYSRFYLESLYMAPGQDFVTKLNPVQRNSKLIFNLPKFEAWQKRQIKAQARRR